MTEYRYSRQDQAAFREFYMYSPYEGEKFIDAYEDDRNNVCLALDTLIGKSSLIRHEDFFSIDKYGLSDIAATLQDYIMVMKSNFEIIIVSSLCQTHKKTVLGLYDLLSESQGSDLKLSPSINNFIGTFERHKGLLIKKINCLDPDHEVQALDDLCILALSCVLSQPSKLLCRYKSLNTLLKINDLLIFRFRNCEFRHPLLLYYSIFFERFMLRSVQKLTSLK
jgi:hypothetical protein